MLSLTQKVHVLHSVQVNLSDSWSYIIPVGCRKKKYMGEEEEELAGMKLKNYGCVLVIMCCKSGS